MLQKDASVVMLQLVQVISSSGAGSSLVGNVWLQAKQVGDFFILTPTTFTLRRLFLISGASMLNIINFFNCCRFIGAEIFLIIENANSYIFEMVV